MESFYDLGGDMDSVSQVGSERNSQCNSISYNDIAAKLINDRLLLTALEFHSELVETGKELPKLRDFFSNPGNFEFQSRNDLTLSIPRSSSQATLDSLDFTRYSEDGERTAEDRVAVLEFELRKANEKINSLRANLTVATECETPTRDGDDGSNSVLNEAIKPHEQRALNFLINEYLLTRGYKLTSITFADQNEEQDFEDWDDVGLNISKPVGLLQLYRAGLRSISSVNAESIDSTSQTEDSFDFVTFENMVEENKELKEKLLLSQKEKLELVLDCESYERDKEEKLMISVSSQCDDDHSHNSEFSSIEKLVSSHERLVSSSEKLTNSCEKLVQTEETQTLDPIQVQLTSEAVAAIEEAINNLKNINYNSGFEKEVVRELVSCSEEWSGPNSVTSEMLIQTLSPTIINIAQTLPINSNKEWLKDIIHLLVHLILLYPNSRQRDNLMQCLLNLKKRPQEDDRNLIVAGLVRVARSQGSEEIIEAHLLPQCWDLMTNKYPEKRLLVVNICSKIALYISSELRNSLLISVLQQLLLEDKEESVRIGCVHGLSVIGAFLQDSDKYSQLEELSLKALDDPSERVSEAALKYLLPVVAKWSLDSSQLESHFVPSVISLIQSQLKVDRGGLSGIKGLTSILPHLVISVASDPHILDSISQDLPPAQTRVGFSGLCTGLCSPLLFYSPRSEETVGSIMRTFDFCLRENQSWPRLDWLQNTMLPQVLDLLDSVDPAKEDCVLSFINFFKNLFAGFGLYLVQHQMKEVFMNRIDKLEAELMDVSKSLPPLTLIPVFVLSLLAPLQVFSREEVGEWLERFLVALSLSRASLAPLHIIFRHACKSADLVEPVMAAIWKGVVHPSSEVKVVSAQLFFDVVPHCSEQVVTGRVVPALITLAADPNLAVRVCTLPTFGLIMEHSSNKEVLDKIRLQIQSVLTDSSLVTDHKSLVSAVTSLSKISPHCEPNFREEVVIMTLSRFVERAHQITNDTCRSELAEALVEAYSNTIYCPISPLTISNNLLPALRQLTAICSESLPSHLDTVIHMERELDSRSTPTSPQQRLSNVSLNLSPSNVEEMKQKVSKMFNSPISKPNIPNLPNFFKKK